MQAPTWTIFEAVMGKFEDTVEHIEVEFANLFFPAREHDLDAKPLTLAHFCEVYKIVDRALNNASSTD